MSEILLMAESGSDITPELAAEYGILVVPMHVSFGEQTYDDGTFPVTQMFEQYKQTRKPPRTSGCTPNDFEEAFARAAKEHPGKQILHLAYSACTTCSTQSCVIAADGREDVHMVDTKSVSAGQLAVVLRVARAMKENPDLDLEALKAIAQEAVDTVRMGFVPGDLEYLRAGGRVSNAAYLGAKILNLHPLIEIQDGKLMSTKKYRGAKERVIRQMVREYPKANALAKDELILIYGEGLDEKIRQEAEAIAREEGYAHVWWVKTGCVISAHSGPGAFGIVGFTQQ